MKPAAAFVCLGAALAQQPVAPTRETVGTARGQNWEGYNIRQSFEVGVRFLDVDGNRDRYRSDVNYRNGLRLLSSRMEIHSREGQGRFFDELVWTTLGLGNDPYQNVGLRIEKNSLYRYEFNWRLNEYFNPALTISNGQHRRDTSRRIQDHLFTLFPSSSFRILGGYTRNILDGPALTTVNTFEFHNGSEFPLFQSVRRQQNEYRVGFEATVAGFKVIAWRNWEYYKDDTEDSASGASSANPENPTTLDSFYRTQPNHGASPGWRVNLFSETIRWLAFNGRFTWVNGRRNFLLDESASGLTRLGSPLNRQVVVSGNAERPMLAANATFTLFPQSRIFLTNHTSFTQLRMVGDSFYQQFDNRNFSFSSAAAEFLGLRTGSNTTDTHFQWNRWISVVGGYHYATRRVRSRRNEIDAEQSNHLHAGHAGVRIRNAGGFSLNLDGELGRDNNPFYPTSPKNYHALNARIEYKRRSFRLTGQARSNYNFNYSGMWSFNSRSRQYTIDGSWTPASWLSFDAGYSKVHLDSLTGIAYWLDQSLIENDSSWYVSNLHTVTAGMHLSLGKRADLYAAWSRVQDRGGPGRVVTVPAFANAQTYPFTFNSPLVRLSIPINQKVRWNAGYQFYGYGESYLPVQNYRANTAYTSLLWAF